MNARSNLTVYADSGSHHDPRTLLAREAFTGSVRTNLSTGAETVGYTHAAAAQFAVSGR